MSFSIEYTARSRNHALSLLDSNKRHLPAPVFDFLAIALNNLNSAPAGYQRIVLVKASGHLCDGNSYSRSTGTIEVTPIDIPD